MAELSISQSELARRVGITQATVHRLASGRAYGSTHLHRIARELGTTPAYLEGEVDDPDQDAPPPAPPPPVQLITMQVALPPERALARMFEGLLAPLDLSAPKDELAHTLARWLPIGLSQLQDLLPDPSTLLPLAERDYAEADATHHLEPQ